VSADDGFHFRSHDRNVPTGRLRAPGKRRSDNCTRQIKKLSVHGFILLFQISRSGMQQLSNGNPALT
jgi:hypothetical protein